MIDAVSKILIPLLIIAVSILTYFLKKKDDELTLVKNKLSDKKHDTYSEIIGLFFGLLKESKGLNKIDNSQLKSKAIDIKKNLLLLAPDNIVFKYFEFEQSTSSSKRSSTIVKYIELVVLIRKDMGNPKTLLTAQKLLRGLVVTDKDFDEVLSMIDKETNKQFQVIDKFK